MSNITIEINVSLLSYRSWINTSYIGVTIMSSNDTPQIKETELGIDQEGIFRLFLKEASREVLKIFLSRQGDLKDENSQRQIEKIQVSGTSGAGTINVAGHGYGIAFRTDIPGTVDGFVSDNEGYLAARGVDIASDGIDTITFVSRTTGVPFESPVYANVMGDLSGVVSVVQPNIPPSAPFELTDEKVIYRFNEAEPYLIQSAAIQDALREDVENAIYLYIAATWLKSKGRDEFNSFLMAKFNKFTDNINVHLYKLHD